MRKNNDELRMTNKRLRLRCAFFALIIPLLIGLLAPIALANPTSQPAYLWFVFDRVPQAVQLIGCGDLLCEEPTLLMQSGTCRDSKCLNDAPVLKPPHRFECAEKVCLYEESRSSELPDEPYFKLAAQFSDRMRSSSTFMPDFRSAIAAYSDRHLNIITQGNQLRILPDERMKPSRWQLFGKALAITQLSELLLVLPVLAWKKFNKNIAVQVLLTIGFANLLIFPIVWFFFPSLQFFQYSTTRTFGIFSIIIAIVFSTFLNRHKNITISSIIRLVFAWLISLPFVLLIAFITAFFIGYRESLPSAIGVSSTVVLPISAMCAIAWKSWFLDRVTQETLSRWQCLLLSTLMTALSLGLNALLLPAMKPFG